MAQVMETDPAYHSGENDTVVVVIIVSADGTGVLCLCGVEVVMHEGWVTYVSSSLIPLVIPSPLPYSLLPASSRPPSSSSQVQ